MVGDGVFVVLVMNLYFSIRVICRLMVALMLNFILCGVRLVMYRVRWFFSLFGFG